MPSGALWDSCRPVDPRACAGTRSSGAAAHRTGSCARGTPRRPGQSSVASGRASASPYSLSRISGECLLVMPGLSVKQDKGKETGHGGVSEGRRIESPRHLGTASESRNQPRNRWRSTLGPPHQMMVHGCGGAPRTRRVGDPTLLPRILIPSPHS